MKVTDRLKLSKLGEILRVQRCVGNVFGERNHEVPVVIDEPCGSDG